MTGKPSTGATIGLLALTLAGCGEHDAEQLARVARKSAEKVETMTGGAPDKVAHSLDALRANWNEVALDARVTARIRWDKELQGADIRVVAVNNVVELHGTVKDVAQRQRAVELARSTLGVKDVTDALQVPEIAK